ncbi:Protein RALF-like 17 [Cardamine amara subsp. amara]|uniref:Protein RALF-like 17 n=1 Tax=Cardamine amara subsp. amara TaxID=228776 RepID=A0ABD1BX91_CARAN
MAASREFIIGCFLTLLLCNFFMRVDSASAAEVSSGGCGGEGNLRDDNERCVEKVKEDDDDDVDDVYKVINKMRIYA